MSKQTKLFGASTEPKVLTSLELEKAKMLASQISDQIKPLCSRLELVGSIRRQKALVGDIDFVVVANDGNWAKIITCFKKSNVICAGNQLIKINYQAGVDLFQADFYRAWLATLEFSILFAQEARNITVSWQAMPYRMDSD